jgi:tRNA A-37 threonylcarbamoyl transferase component Bud32
MAHVYINPAYQEYLERLGLTRAEHFLNLPGFVVSGHPDRHVVKVDLGAGSQAIGTFLKREHRVRWKDRLASAWAGFGFVSRSVREGSLLRHLAQFGIGCPEVIAAGEFGHRAFLLTRELAGTVDLRVYLCNHVCSDPNRRRLLSCRIGESLARLHQNGFDHPDLYAKHVLIRAEDQATFFLDWQRSRRTKQLRARKRWRDLAALNATLAVALVTPRDRLACLRAYLRNGFPPIQCRNGISSRKNAVTTIMRLTARLLQRRRIRESHEPPLPVSAQNLAWLDGEALCVTREFHSRLNGQVPRWLADWHRKHPDQPRPPQSLTEFTVTIPPGNTATLSCRRAVHPFRGLWNWLWKKPLRSPEVRQVGLMFRLQRYGIATPQLLAFGQKRSSPWGTQSFLLVQRPDGRIKLGEWLERTSRRALSPDRQRQRQQVIREAAALLRRLHAAGCVLGAPPAASLDKFLVQLGHDRRVSLSLDAVAGLQKQRKSALISIIEDLSFLRAASDSRYCSYTDQLRFLVSYLGVSHSTAESNRLARQILAQADRSKRSTLLPAYSWKRAAS